MLSFLIIGEIKNQVSTTNVELHVINCVAQMLLIHHLFYKALNSSREMFLKTQWIRNNFPTHSNTEASQKTDRNGSFYNSLQITFCSDRSQSCVILCLSMPCSTSFSRAFFSFFLLFFVKSIFRGLEHIQNKLYQEEPIMLGFVI